MAILETLATQWETERLLFRRFTPGDAPLLVVLDSDPEVMRFLTGGAPTPCDVIERDILPRFLGESERHPVFGFWAVLEKSSGVFVGWLSFRPAAESDPTTVELGYRIRRISWGRGVATEGANALIRRGFAELGVQRVVATTYEENRASHHVMEKLGLTLVRSYRLTTQELTVETTFEGEAAKLFEGLDVDYALTKEDWMHQRTQLGAVPGFDLAVGAEPNGIPPETSSDPPITRQPAPLNSYFRV